MATELEEAREQIKTVQTKIADYLWQCAGEGSLVQFTKEQCMAMARSIVGMPCLAVVAKDQTLPIMGNYSALGKNWKKVVSK